jgi:hypothetical protein
MNSIKALFSFVAIILVITACKPKNNNGSATTPRKCEVRTDPQLKWLIIDIRGEDAVKTAYIGDTVLLNPDKTYIVRFEAKAEDCGIKNMKVSCERLLLTCGGQLVTHGLAGPDGMYKESYESADIETSPNVKSLILPKNSQYGRVFYNHSDKCNGKPFNMAIHEVVGYAEGYSSFSRTGKIYLLYKK